MKSLTISVKKYKLAGLFVLAGMLFFLKSAPAYADHLIENYCDGGAGGNNQPQCSRLGDHPGTCPPADDGYTGHSCGRTNCCQSGDSCTTDWTACDEPMVVHYWLEWGCSFDESCSPPPAPTNTPVPTNTPQPTNTPTPPPPTAPPPPIVRYCTVSLSTPVVTEGQPVAVTLVGNSGEPISRRVNLWVERQNGGVIPIEEISPASTYYTDGTNSYYKIDSAGCNSSGSNCNKTTSVTISNPGSYYFHCDVPYSPNMCSGNPFCAYEGGNQDCPGWVSCSSNDNRTLQVNPAPTNPPGTTYTPTPIPPTPPQTSNTPTPTQCVPQGPAAPGCGLVKPTGDNVSISWTFNSNGWGMQCPVNNEDDDVFRVSYSFNGGPFAEAPPACNGEKGRNTRSCTMIDLQEGAYKYIVEADNGFATSQSPECNFNLVVSNDWYGAKDGDVHAGGGGGSNVPEGKYFIDNGLSDPGVLSYWDGSFDYGDGQVSSEGWNASSPHDAPPYNYGYLRNTLFNLQTLPDEMVKDGVLDDGELQNLKNLKGNFLVEGLPNGTLTFAGNWDIGDGANPSKVLLLVDGDVKIDGRIRYVGSSGLPSIVVIAASGDIEIGHDIAPGDSNVEELNGVFIADGVFRTLSEGPNLDDKLVVFGTAVGWSGVELQRDLPAASEDQPAEMFTLRPEHIIAISPMWNPKIVTWREVAP